MNDGENIRLILALLLVIPYLVHMADSTGLLEGDIAVPGTSSGKTDVQQSFLENELSLWSEGRVFYKFEKFERDGGDFEQLFKKEDMNLIREVLQEISEAVPCIEFKAAADSYVGDHILFTSMGDADRSADGCWSFVGRVGPQGGKAGQSLNIGYGCAKKEILFHEVLHALGATHEQNREDRDLFVKINFDNILDNAKVNFDKKTSTFSSRGTPYDYTSVMHYQALDFSKNNQSTITPLRRNIKLRHRSDLSPVDVIELARVYEGLTQTSCYTKQSLLSYAKILETTKYQGSCQAAVQLYSSQNTHIESLSKAAQTLEKTRKDQSKVILDLQYEIKTITNCEKEVELSESLQRLIEEQKKVIDGKTGSMTTLMNLENTIKEQGEVITKQNEVISSLRSRMGLQASQIELDDKQDEAKQCWAGTLMMQSPLAVCITDSKDREWILVQRRGQFNNKPEYFARTFQNYQEGFIQNQEMWLGLDAISALTNQAKYELLVELTTWESIVFPSKHLHAVYSSFRVGASPGYTLYVSGYDASQSTLGDSLAYHSGKMFSAVDNDQDIRSSGNCSSHMGGNGGWWFGSCHHTNLNGINYPGERDDINGMVWLYGGTGQTGRANGRNTFKETRMLIRKLDN